MEAMRLFGFVVVVLVAFGMLAAILELLNPERYQVQASAEEGKRRAAGVRIAEPKVTAIPAFFAKSHVNDPSLMPVGFDDGLLALLQHHVKAEQDMVHEFVRFPSVDNLYRQSGSFLRAH